MTKSPSPIVDEVARDELSSWLETLDSCLETFWAITEPGTDNRLLAEGAQDAAKAIASLVSPPKAGSGEFRARIVHCEDCYSQGTVATLDRYKSMMASPCQNCGAPARALRWVYAVANHEARGDGERVTDEMIDREWNRLCEKDDRSSPAEYPDMALITRDELAIAIRALANPGDGE